MSGLMSPSTLSPTLLTPTPQTTISKLAQPAGGTVDPATDPAREQAIARTKDAAQKFESQFLSVMFQHMFEGVETDGPFGGGKGEEMFRSMMTDAMGKQVAKAGGIGIAASVQREMLKMQGLS